MRIHQPNEGAKRCNARQQQHRYWTAGSVDISLSSPFLERRMVTDVLHLIDFGVSSASSIQSVNIVHSSEL
jgi:predicted solute-binding protein